MSAAADDFDALKARNAELGVLYATIQDLTSTLAVHEVLERLLDRTLLHLEAEIGSVQLLDADGLLRAVVSRGLPEDELAETRIGAGEGISGWVLAHEEPVLVCDIERDPRFAKRNHERYYTHSCISAPLRIDGDVRGVLNVNNKTSHESFSASDLVLLEAIAGHAAVALHNAERYEEMLDRAARDPLTGLANHGAFWAELRAELGRADRHDRPLSVVLIDLDEFKRVNDVHGHLEGDRALRAVACAIRSQCRSHDAVARYGGDEFAIVLPETGASGAKAFGEKIRRQIDLAGAGASASVAGSGFPSLTASVGAAERTAERCTAEALVEAADAALYAAKARGRNRVNVAPSR